MLSGVFGGAKGGPVAAEAAAKSSAFSKEDLAEMDRHRKAAAEKYRLVCFPSVARLPRLLTETRPRLASRSHVA
jgi:hypothetical protein